METLQAKPQAKAESLQSRVFAATLCVAAHEKSKYTKAVLVEWMREVAALAGMTFQREGDEYFTLTGFGVVLSDSFSSHNLNHNLSGRYPALLGGAAGPSLPKYDIRLTPGLTAQKAAKIITAELSGIQAYHEAVERINAERRALLDRTRAEAARLLAVLPGTGRSGHPRARYYARTPEDNTQPTRDLVFYPENGATTAANVQVWGTAQMQLSSVPLDLAEAILRLVASYEKPA